MEFFDIRLVGINAENGQKLIVTVALVVILALIRRLIAWVQRSVLAPRASRHTSF